MEERVYASKVEVTLDAEGASKTIYLFLENGEFSVDYDKYETTEQALEDFMFFMKFAHRRECSKVMQFKETPHIYEVFDDKISKPAQRVVPGNWKGYAIFLLDSFKEFSLNEIAEFTKNYCESKCSKEFSFVSFVPCLKSDVKLGELPDYNAFFKRSAVIRMSLEELKKQFMEMRLIGYMHL